MRTTSLLEPRAITLKEEFWEFNLSTRHKKIVFICRATLIAILIAFTIFNAITAIAIVPDSTSCLWDGVFELTEPINTFFVENQEPKNAILIFSSFLIDCLLLWFSIRYAFWGRSSRQMIFFSLFYGTRGVIQRFFLMRVPPGYAWDYPGFPSLTVSYEKTSDFFYSGHVGVMLFCALENRHLGNYYMMWVALFVCALEFVIMIFLRGHYSVDLISGLVFSHYYWIVSEGMADKLDKFLGLGKYL